MKRFVLFASIAALLVGVVPRYTTTVKAESVIEILNTAFGAPTSGTYDFEALDNNGYTISPFGFTHLGASTVNSYNNGTVSAVPFSILFVNMSPSNRALVVKAHVYHYNSSHALIHDEVINLVN